jgi:hypothetical protein
MAKTLKNLRQAVEATAGAAAAAVNEPKTGSNIFFGKRQV